MIKIKKKMKKVLVAMALTLGFTSFSQHGNDFQTKYVIQSINTTHQIAFGEDQSNPYIVLRMWSPEVFMNNHGNTLKIKLGDKSVVLGAANLNYCKEYPTAYILTVRYYLTCEELEILQNNNITEYQVFFSYTNETRKVKNRKANKIKNRANLI